MCESAVTAGQSIHAQVTKTFSDDAGDDADAGNDGDDGGNDGDDADAGDEYFEEDDDRR